MNKWIEFSKRIFQAQSAKTSWSELLLNADLKGWRWHHVTRWSKTSPPLSPPLTPPVPLAVKLPSWRSTRPSYRCRWVSSIVCWMRNFTGILICLLNIFKTFIDIQIFFLNKNFNFKGSTIFLSQLFYIYT